MSVADLVKQWTANGASSLPQEQAKQLLSEVGLRIGEPDRPAVELRIAVEQDVLFGHVIAFSYGRMAMDVWDDVAYRIVPLTEKDARLMVREPKASAVLLGGYGSLEAPEASLIEQVILKLSDLAEHNPQISEIDLDPVYVLSDGIVVKSARIELSP